MTPSLLTLTERVIRNKRTSTMNVRQLGVLAFVECHEKQLCTVRGLAAHFRIDKPNITHAVNRLQQLGMVVRERDQADRRSMFIVIRPAGKNFLRDLAVGDWGMAA